MAGKWKGKKVAVLMGGLSKEREISLRTGSAIAAALARRGYECVTIDVGEGRELVAKLGELGPDAAVIALHGKFGEDGCVQGLLEMLRIPYTGGGVMASSIGMDKAVCSRIARSLGIPCPAESSFDSSRLGAGRFAAEFDMELPVIVKPSREGSTINMTIVRSRSELLPALELAALSDTKIVVESYVAGKEVTVGVLNGRPLPVLEIAPKSGFYDFKSKYTKGMTEYIVPARIDAAVAGRLQEWSAAIYREIECFGTARCDFIVAEGGEYFLEINTIPGMTELSLVPKAAAHVGIGFDDLCEELLEGAALKVNA